MSRIVIGLCITLVLGLTACTSMPNTPTNPPATVAKVDLPRYMGSWQEVARLPMFFQRNCAKDSRANYTLTKDGEQTVVQVVNSCLNKDGKRIQARAIAKPVGDAKLKVNFAPKFVRALGIGNADYWVLALDDDYRYAMVGTPNKRYLWLLAREQMPTDIQNRYIALAKSQGYPTQDLVFDE